MAERQRRFGKEGKEQSERCLGSGVLVGLADFVDNTDIHLKTQIEEFVRDPIGLRWPHAHPTFYHLHWSLLEYICDIRSKILFATVPLTTQATDIDLGHQYDLSTSR
jgi:hypothetical protein